VAIPPFRVPVPIVVEPSRKITLPVGEPVDDTAADNVTASPRLDVDPEEDSNVVVASGPNGSK